MDKLKKALKIIAVTLFIGVVVFFVSGLLSRCDGSGIKFPQWFEDLFSWIPKIEVPWGTPTDKPKPDEGEKPKPDEGETPTPPQGTHYTVNFLNGKEIYKTVSVKENTSVGELFPDAPERYDAEFLGWYIVTDGQISDSRFTAETIVTADTTVMAKWLCEDCEYIFKNDFIDDYGHDCYLYLCKTCDSERNITIHNYVYVNTLEEKDKQGHTQKEYKCEKCNKEETVSFHEFGADGKCGICGFADCMHEYEHGLCVKCGRVNNTYKNPSGSGGDGEGGDGDKDPDKPPVNPPVDPDEPDPPIPPEHTCESKCSTCGGCTNADCTQTACADKCAGHAPPAHTCTSRCPTCYGCLNADCTETDCSRKCQGHTPDPDYSDGGYWKDLEDNSNVLTFGQCLCGDCDKGCDCYILGYCRFGKCDCSDTDIPEDMTDTGFIDRTCYLNGESDGVTNSPAGEPTAFKVAFVFDMPIIKRNDFIVVQRTGGDNPEELYFELIVQANHHVLFHKATLAVYGLDDYPADYRNFTLDVTERDRENYYFTIKFPESLNYEEFFNDERYRDVKLVVRVFAKPANIPNVKVNAINDYGQWFESPTVDLDFVKFYPDGSSLYQITAPQDYWVRRIEVENFYYTYGKSTGFTTYCKFPALDEYAFGIFECTVTVEPRETKEFKDPDSKVNVSAPSFVHYSLSDNGNGTFTFRYEVESGYKYKVKDISSEDVNVISKQIGAKYGYMTFSLSEYAYDPEHGLRDYLSFLFLIQE